MHVFGAPGLVCSTWDLYSRHVGSSSLIRDPTWGSCIGTQPLDHQGSPYRCGIFNKILSILESTFHTNGHFLSRGLEEPMNHGDWVENGG